MRAVSSRFLETLRGSHTAVFRATVCSTFQTGTAPSGVPLAVKGGDVTLSARNTIRGTLQVETLHSWPTSAGDDLTPYGHEIYVERGIRYGNGQTEHVGLGYYRINTPEQDETPDGPIMLAGSDRMAGIVDGRFLAPRQFSAALTRGALVDLLIKEVYPAAVIEWEDGVLRDGAVGRSVIEEEDRAKCLTDFMTAIAQVGYFDHRGVFVIKAPPSIDGPPAWSVDAGENGVMIRMGRALTREGVHNAYVATGEAGDTTPPARGVALNLDPTSPTYYYGPFGPVPAFFSSPFLTTNAAAAKAAATLLRKEIGLPYQVTLDAMANAALEPYDVITVRYPRQARNRSLRSETHVIDEAKIALTEKAPVTLQTREQRIDLVGPA